MYKYCIILFLCMWINTCRQLCPSQQYYQFYLKSNINQYQIIGNPYKKPSQQYLDKVRQNLINKERVCAIRYLDHTSKFQYQLKNFFNKKQAQQLGWIVTHQGVCGKCSTTKDLYVYLTKNLTKPVRSCGLKHFNSHYNLRLCIRKLGFTNPCAQVWYWNTLNTKKQCGLICFISYITHQPYIINGKLNRCLQCDENNSGPIFKYQSGRTRRNSGIKSQIDRPDEQIYNVTHCYY